MSSGFNVKWHTNGTTPYKSSHITDQTAADLNFYIHKIYYKKKIQKTLLLPKIYIYSQPISIMQYLLSNSV